MKDKKGHEIVGVILTFFRIALLLLWVGFSGLAISNLKGFVFGSDAGGIIFAAISGVAALVFYITYRYIGKLRKRLTGSDYVI